MQELYDWVQQRDFYISKEWIKCLLEKEKQQIAQAFDFGYDREDMSGEEYYKNTYKTVSK